MSRFAKEIAEFLDAAGVGVYSTPDPTQRTIFTGKLPVGVAEGLNITESIGPAPHAYTDQQYPILDFTARSDAPDRAHLPLS